MNIIWCFTLFAISFSVQNSTFPLQNRFGLFIQDWVNYRYNGTYYFIFTKFLSTVQHSNGLISSEVELQVSNCTKEKLFLFTDYIFTHLLVRRSNGCHELFLNHPSYTLLCTVLHYGFGIPIEALNKPELQCHNADSTVVFEIEEQTRIRPL
ncbi:hypothetical protein T4D_5605 [Trichinella pseudospiralis]|uniref:Uncharacterized protein n=1 Tax=Trichinella pseudospiralis TaxID=6337 RepID=A0A0V1G2J2_TRIPS|nr:hypothetical protein T4D_5605 [Trichinella pseudospiralis]